MMSGLLSVAGTKVLTLIIGLITTPILYRLLEPKGVGIYTTVLSVFSMFMILVSSGITDGVRKFLAEDRDMDCWEEHVVGFYFRLALLLSVAGSIVLALCAWFGLVKQVFGPDFEPYFYILALLVMTQQFRAYSRRTLMGFGLERYSEPLKIVQQVVFLAVALPLVKLGFGVGGALAGKIVGGALVAVIGMILVTRQVSLSGVVRKTPNEFPRRTMLTFNSLSIVLIFLLMSLYHVDILMLQLISGSNEQVGYYRAALKLAEFLWFIPMALQTVFVHSMSELWSNGETERISKLSALTTRYTFLLTGVMALGLAALSNVAVPVYFGKEYMPAVTPLILLLPGALGFAVARPILAISQGKGNLKYPILATGTAAGMNFVLNLLLIPRYGMQGAAISTSIGYGSMFIFHIWSARRVGFNPLSDARLGRVLVTTILSAPPIFVLANWLDVRPLIFGIHVPLSLVTVPPLGLAVFAFFCFATGALGVSEVLDTVSSFPEPLGSRAETLQTKVSENTMSTDSIQKLMIVAGVLLFVSGIGYAFLDPGFGGIGGPTQGSSVNSTQTTDPGTTGAGTTHSTTPSKSQTTTKSKETTKGTTASSSTTISTPPPSSSTTSTTSPPDSSTTSSTNPPPSSSTTSTTSPPTSGTTTSSTTSTTSTTSTSAGTTTTTTTTPATTSTTTTTTNSTTTSGSASTTTTGSTTTSGSTSTTTMSSMTTTGSTSTTTTGSTSTTTPTSSTTSSSSTTGSSTGTTSTTSSGTFLIAPTLGAITN
nr:flippase [Haladaptatus sp. AB643]